MGTYLSTPVLDKHSEDGSDLSDVETPVRWAVVDMQGWRKSMEDAHVARTDVCLPWNYVKSKSSGDDGGSGKEDDGGEEEKNNDGATHANITFIRNEVEYPANGFDGGFPPTEIAELVNKIVELGEK